MGMTHLRIQLNWLHRKNSTD